MATRTRRARKCAICREPGHTKADHTPMERQRFRLTGKVERPATTGTHECSECFAPAYSKHLPHCRKYE